MKTRTFLVFFLSFLGLTGCFKTRQEIAREKEEAEVRSSLQQNIVDYSQAMEKTQADLGRLQGRIEEIEHQRKKEMSGLTAGRESEHKAIEEIKAKLASIQEAQNALFEEVKKLKEESIAAAAAARSSPAPAPAGPKKKAGGPSFSAAFADYKGKRYQIAATGFRDYLEAHPKGKRSLDARFYLGESLFRQKEYERAAAEFGAVHEKASGTALGRKSTLRLAQSFLALGKAKDAKAFAQLLVQESPGSDEAKSARKLLR